MRAASVLTCFVVVCACAARGPVDSGAGGSYADVRALNQFPAGFHGIFVLSVSEVIHQERPTDTNDIGNHVRASVLEQLLEGQPFDEGESWRVGAEVIVTDGNPSPSPCPHRSLAAGEKIIAYPSFHMGQVKTQFGPARMATLYGSFTCLDSDTATFDHWDGRSGFVQSASVGLPVLEAYYRLPFGNSTFYPSLQQWAGEVRTACGNIRCGDGESCFFGLGCATVRLRTGFDDSFFSGLRMRADGVTSEQLGASSSSGAAGP